jgi:hypothetical protein
MDSQFDFLEILFLLLYQALLKEKISFCIFSFFLHIQRILLWRICGKNSVRVVCGTQILPYSPNTPRDIKLSLSLRLFFTNSKNIFDLRSST